MILPSLYRGYRHIGDKIFYAKSLWEANYARYLEWQKQQGMISDWFYEPHIFFFEKIKSGTRVYTPDFYVLTKENSYWVEVKGFYDSKSLTKIKRFRKYFSDKDLRLVDVKWFKVNTSKMKLIIPDWETPHSLRILTREEAHLLRENLAN